MTPATATPAARRTAERSIGRQSASRSPRRVSGPVRGRDATMPRRSPRPGVPRFGLQVAAQLPAGVSQFVRALPDHSLLDRIVRGRTWIALLGVMLAGIVAMQVEVLKYGASIGRSLERGTVLQSRNELLRANVSRLSDDQRIEGLATAGGMAMPPPENVGFLGGRSASVARAIANITPPDTATFLAHQTSNGAVTTTTDTPANGGRAAATIVPPPSPTAPSSPTAPPSPTAPSGAAAVLAGG